MRKLRTTFLASVHITLVLTFASFEAVATDYRLTPITKNIQVIYGPFDLPDNKNRGFRNNVVVVTTSEGLVIFDPGGSAYTGEMVARALKGLTPKPIVAVFNSHAHGDHWLGNEGIRKHHPDALIYGHPKMKARIEGPDGYRWLDLINRVTKGTAEGKVIIGPNRTVDDGDVVTVGDTRFRIHHTGLAHTDNDIMIEIVGQNVLYIGDVVRNGLLGIMEEDASFKGNIAAIDAMLEKKFSSYIPGHGQAGGEEMLTKYRSYLQIVRTKVKKLYEKGLRDYEMKAEVVKSLSAYKGWAGFELRVGPHITRAFLEVEAEDFETSG